MKSPSVDSAVAYTAAGAAVACGLPRGTIDFAVQQGALKATRSGRRFVILRDDLVAWLRQCQQEGVIPSPVADEDRERLAELNRRRKQERTKAMA